MIEKEIKNYSGRCRINITNKDDLKPGDKVVIFRDDDFKKYKENILNLQSQLRTTEDKLQNYKDQEQNVEKLIKIALTPIEEHYQKEIKKLEDTITAKDNEINRLKAIYTNFSTSMNGVSLWDMVRGKHKNLIDDFSNKIWIPGDDDQLKEVEKLD